MHNFLQQKLVISMFCYILLNLVLYRTIKFINDFLANFCCLNRNRNRNRNECIRLEHIMTTLNGPSLFPVQRNPKSRLDEFSANPLRSLPGTQVYVVKIAHKLKYSFHQNCFCDHSDRKICNKRLKLHRNPELNT